MPQLSVVVPVYKVEKYLHRCVDSILAQSFSDFELILVDDGSPDRCGEICEEYAQRDKRIRVIHRQNGGLSAARNTGVADARCEWVCFVDSDDCIHPDMLLLLYRAAAEPGVNMAVCDCVQAATPPDDFLSKKDGAYTVKTIDQDTLLTLFNEHKRAYWTVVPVLVKTEIVKNNLFTVGRIFEDNAVSTRWLHAAKTVAFLEDKLYFYMTNPDGIVHESFGPKRLDFLWALEEQLSFYETVGYSALQGAVARHYVECARWFADRIKTELNDPALARSVIRKAVRIRKQYAENGGFTPEDDRKLFKAAHPFLHRVKKRLHIQ